jgi:LmbE family N-acetylglucosaminyl deacetylase
MKILYIFPHPDDESFGPAQAISNQIRKGYEVYLLTLTKGEATKQRLKLGYSLEEMGEVRYNEMLNVKKVLNLTGMNVLNFPDSNLKELDPREIEKAVKNEILKIKPNVIVTYAVHGISGFHDHLITHAIVKRVYCELRETEDYLKRLAFFTINEEDAKKTEHFKLNFSKDDEIDCIIECEPIDIENNIKALECYNTYKEVIDASNIKNFITGKSVFEIFQEKFDPKLNDICIHIK